MYETGTGGRQAKNSCANRCRIYSLRLPLRQQCGSKRCATATYIDILRVVRMVKSGKCLDHLFWNYSTYDGHGIAESPDASTGIQNRDVMERNFSQRKLGAIVTQRRTDFLLQVFCCDILVNGEDLGPGVMEVWLIDLPKERVYVFRRPAKSGYAEVHSASGSESLKRHASKA